MNRLVIATHNTGKFEEFRAILAPWADRLVPLSEAAPAEGPPEETDHTYEENARLKALKACRATGLPCLADDSGIEVAALHGAPGPLSARFAGERADAAANNALLLERLRDVPEGRRDARYVAHLALALPDGRLISARGECRGRVVREPQGRKGFGYDPLFFAPAFGKTFAQMPSELKNRVSHRARAARQLFPVLLDVLGAPTGPRPRAPR